MFTLLVFGGQYDPTLKLMGNVKITVKKKIRPKSEFFFTQK